MAGRPRRPGAPVSMPASRFRRLWLRGRGARMTAPTHGASGKAKSAGLATAGISGRHLTGRVSEYVNVMKRHRRRVAPQGSR